MSGMASSRQAIGECLVYNLIQSSHLFFLMVHFSTYLFVKSKGLFSFDGVYVCLG